MKKIVFGFVFSVSVLFASSTLVVDKNYIGVGGTGINCEGFSTNTYETIQAAINDAGNGDTIEICSGTYNEAVVVDKKNLTLKGVDGQSPSDVVMDAGSNIGITLKKKNITLENFKVKSSNNYGIYGNYNAKGEHTFKHLIIDANSRGIYLDNGSKQTFEDLDITAGDIGIYTDANVNGEHTFKNITIHSTGNAIQIDKGGKSFESLNLTSDNGRGIDVVDTPADLTFKDIRIHSKWEGILTRYNAKGEKSFNDIKISSQGKSIYVDGGKKATFDNIEANSSNDIGIYLSANPKGDHTFNHITINAKNEALYVGKGGKTFTNLKLNSSDSRGLDIEDTTTDLDIEHVFINSKNEGILLRYNVSGDKILKDINVTSGGTCIYAEKGFSSLTDANLTSSGDRGVREATYRDTTITNVKINAKKEGILFDWGNNVDITVKNSSITSTDPNDGIYASRSKHFTVDSVCIKKAKRGIYAPWDVRNVVIKNSKIENTTDWVVVIDSDRSAPAKVNNNCLSGAKLAYSNGLVHNFDENYWDGVNDVDGDGKITHSDAPNKIFDYVVDNSPKNSCEANGCGGSIQSPTCNLQNGLTLSTYDITGYDSNQHPNNHDAYNSLETNYAVADKL
ncbi:MAG: right-handed parallel beta-helix repeat-containing protein, partial [Sulfurospirillum sp.]